jgi:tetratricopeptide (TPR) repeat protein
MTRRRPLILAIAFFLIPVCLWPQDDAIGGKRIAINKLLSEKKFGPALVMIQQEIENAKKTKQPPYVENDTLYLYAETGEDAMILRLQVLAAAKLSEAEQKKLAWYQELRGQFEWKKIDTIEPFLPYLYYCLAYIAVEKEDWETALKYLDQALALWPRYYGALAEKNHVYINTGKFAEAKTISRQVIADTYPVPKKRKAVFYRNLGYIAIEEGDLDAAEEYYKTSLDLEPGNKIAKNELEYIGKEREKRSNAIR